MSGEPDLLPVVPPFAQGRNPDVLTCIANLSNDEVFTPPELANQMLDLLAERWAEANGGESIWSRCDVTFLDPFTKSGVFLREITKRLVPGLAADIPNLDARVDHILKTQVYGIGITELTAQLARRSLYCSKDASGQHSIASTFVEQANPDGNVWFERTDHEWVKGRCRFCGVAEKEYKRDSNLETHAYAFIHCDNIEARLGELFGDEVKFDVIIGNPPYQLGSDGGTRDVPIYHHFVEQAKKLQPLHLVMVTPSRWMAGGLGLSEYRDRMLNDKRISRLIDFPVSKEVFSEVEIKGGVSYFAWSADHDAKCDVTTVRGGERIGPIKRDLGEFDVFVRDARAMLILKKVIAKEEPSIINILSADKEFGWTSNFDGFHATPLKGDVPIHYVRQGKRMIGYIGRRQVLKSAQLIDTWKVMIPKAGSDGGQRIPDPVLGKTLIAGSPSVCTQTFLFFYVNDKEAARSIESYVQSRFFRFLVSLRKITQDATRGTYTWVPQQTWDRTWTDAALYKKYGLTRAEIDYIEAVISPVKSTEVKDGD